MRYFPIFLNMARREVIIAGSGEVALAKLRLIAKSEASVTVFAPSPSAALLEFAERSGVSLVSRRLEEADAKGAALIYAASGDDAEDARVAGLGREAGVLVNAVDNLEASDFITPAIVDRDPLTIAIGTEGAAPVLARNIKAHLEEYLPSSIGRLTRLAGRFRDRLSHLSGREARAFWTRFFSGPAEQALNRGGEEAALDLAEKMIEHPQIRPAGHVEFVGAGPGDPELLTLKARKALHLADVVLHDRLVSDGVLELARREARIIEVGKTGFAGKGVRNWTQGDINALMIREAGKGAQIVRLKSGDPVVFGRLDEEIHALKAAGIEFSIIPGITAASAAAASLGASLTSRGRNSEFRLLTGHDMKGFSRADWAALAGPDQCAAIYMGAKMATQIRGRLLMHGADPATPISVVSDASGPQEKRRSTNLLDLPEAISEFGPDAPIIILYGIQSGEAGKEERAALLKLRAGNLP